jgi:hypothetical protein
MSGVRTWSLSCYWTNWASDLIHITHFEPIRALLYRNTAIIWLWTSLMDLCSASWAQRLSSQVWWSFKRTSWALDRQLVWKISRSYWCAFWNPRMCVCLSLPWMLCGRATRISCTRRMGGTTSAVDWGYHTQPLLHLLIYGGLISAVASEVSEQSAVSWNSPRAVCEIAERHGAHL